MQRPEPGPSTEQAAFSTMKPDARITDLFQQILQHVQDNGERTSNKHKEDQDILLEISIDGIHYKLSRSSIQYVETRVSLSPREKEIVRLVARGLANKAIAAVLDVSPWTVATHIRRIFSKLGVVSRAEMIAKVLEGGLLEDG
jgi:two-component system, NarL family, nitrate/nitrite response regulator NarL